MWEFMCNYADLFYNNVEAAGEVIKVLWAWIITLLPMGFLAVLEYLILYLLYWGVKDTFDRRRAARRGESEEQ